MNDVSESGEFSTGHHGISKRERLMDTDMAVNWIDCVWRKRPGASLGFVLCLYSMC